MVSDVQIWKLTFHAPRMASETGPDENCRRNLATASDIERPGEKIKKVLAKALNLILGGGSHMLQYARPTESTLGNRPTSKAANVGYQLV